MNEITKKLNLVWTKRVTEVLRIKLNSSYVGPLVDKSYKLSSKSSKKTGMLMSHKSLQWKLLKSFIYLLLFMVKIWVVIYDNESKLKWTNIYKLVKLN